MRNLANTSESQYESKGVSSDLGLYIHIPFCRKRCHFCAFYLVMVAAKRVESFLEALEQEIHLYAHREDLESRKVATVYFGGGTPTVLSPLQLSKILENILRNFSLVENREVTVETTPESLTSDYLESLSRVGVTRLSVGVQTFDDQERRKLGLSCTRKEAMAGIHLAQEHGFSNINLDLIYGIPGQSLGSWDKTLSEALACNPSHLSCYALTIEEGTRFHAEFQRGKFQSMDSTIEEDYLWYVQERLETDGYQQYEISNWAKSGQRCRHNLRYWQGREYLGLGPSAQSFIGKNRFGNVSNLDRYVKHLQVPELPIETYESLAPLQNKKERVVFGLRLLEGVPLRWVDELDQDQVWINGMNRMLQEKYLTKTSSHLLLTTKGRRFADAIGIELL